MCPKIIRKAPDQMCETEFYICAHFLLFWLLFTLWIYLSQSFHLNSRHRHPDPPHFLHFHPDSSHSHFIPCILTLILRISLISFSNSPFWFLQVAKIEHSSLLLLHNFRHEIIICIIYDVISVITKIYLPYFYNLWSRIK